jgi:nucleotide-binding universal stress UspA family protein
VLGFIGSRCFLQEITMFKHLLVPTDGSPLSSKAARAAVEFARAVDGRITALSVAEPYPYSALAESAYLPDQARYEKEMQDHACQFVDEVAELASAAGVPCDTRVGLSFSPYEEIAATAKELACDAIFMASHGRKGINRLFVGSETQKVLAHTTLPVMVFR